MRSISSTGDITLLLAAPAFKKDCVVQRADDIHRSSLVVALTIQQPLIPTQHGYDSVNVLIDADPIAAVNSARSVTDRPASLGATDPGCKQCLGRR